MLSFQGGSYAITVYHCCAPDSARTILLLYFFTNWFQGVFANLLAPILGFIFLPTTLLWYSAVQHWFGGEWGIISIGGMVVALIIDLFPARKRRAVQAAA